MTKRVYTIDNVANGRGRHAFHLVGRVFNPSNEFRVSRLSVLASLFELPKDCSLRKLRMGHSEQNLPTPPGFECLNSEKPITFYMRHLPHWRQAGATYFVTFRQADSLSQEVLLELRELKQQWERRHPLLQPESKW